MPIEEKGSTRTMIAVLPARSLPMVGYIVCCGNNVDTDDKDTSYSLGGSKGKKGKPQKGKGLPPPRKRRPPAKKSGKSPGKVFFI